MLSEKGVGFTGAGAPGLSKCGTAITKKKKP
jgi:hypothetical protein